MKQYLFYIFNSALSAIYFSDLLKHAHMIFIPKAGWQHFVRNDRPILLLEIYGKRLDKILINKRISHLNTHNVMNSRQHRFRVRGGIYSALATRYETISQDICNKHKMDIVLRTCQRPLIRSGTRAFSTKLQSLTFTYVSPEYSAISWKTEQPQSE